MIVIKRTDRNFIVEMTPDERNDSIELAGFTGLSEEETLKQLIQKGITAELRDWRDDADPHDNEE